MGRSKGEGTATLWSIRLEKQHCIPPARPGAADSRGHTDALTYHGPPPAQRTCKNWRGKEVEEKVSEAEVYICSAPFSASTSSTKRQSCRHTAQGSTKGCSLPPVLQPDAAAHCLTRNVDTLLTQPCLLSPRATSPRQEGTGPPAQLQTQQQLKATPKPGSSFSQQHHEHNFSSHWTEQRLGGFDPLVGTAGGLGRERKGVWGHFSTGERFANPSS